MLAEIAAGRLRLRELHRFAVTHRVLGGTMQWDFLGLWESVLESLRACRQAGYRRFDAVGVDTWGCDFGLIGQDGKLLYSPVCYRDGRTEGIERKIAAVADPYELYRITGLPVLRVNTLSQLVGLSAGGGGAVLRAGKLMFVSDLLRYFLGGVEGCELTAAGSSQLLDVRRRRWSEQIRRSFKLPRGLLGRLVEPGQHCGKLLPEVCRQTGLESCPVIAVAGHDTADALAAAPYCDQETCLISCGTWALMGLVLPRDRPLVSRQAYRGRFLNEMGVDSIMFVRNLVGFYPFEQLRQAWTEGSAPASYAGLLREAARQKPFAAMLDFDDPRFFALSDAQAALRNYLKDTGQRPLARPAQIVRTVMEALAWSFRRTLEDLRAVTGRPVGRICMLGGGARNALLCQMTADATGCELLAGPVEATATGNAGLLALGCGLLKCAQDIRLLSRRSFRLRRYLPSQSRLWEKEYPRYRRLASRPQLTAGRRPR
jgi:sugar (pentulose or hexulose) kinase